MVIFHHAAVYIHHKRLFKIIQKQRKLQHSMQFTQLLHDLYTFRKLIYGIHNRILQFCFAHNLH